MTFIISRNNIGQFGEAMQNNNVVTLIIMTNIIHHHDSV
jgi:hypothetical protein